MATPSTTVANLHIQKTGGTSLYLNCIHRCNSTLGRRLQGHISQDEQSTAAGLPCGCRAFFDGHWTFPELDVVRQLARRSNIPFDLATILRDPVERVVSEYGFLRSSTFGVGALYQDQWDYIDQRKAKQQQHPRHPQLDAVTLSPLGARLADRNRPFSLADFIEAVPGRHPAMDRQTRYLGSGATRRWLTQKPFPDNCCMGSITRSNTVAWARHRGGADFASRVGSALDTLASAHDALASRGAPPSNASKQHALAAQPTEADLQRALERLTSEFVAVGVLERAEDTAAAFSARLGWSREWAQARPQHSRQHASELSPGLRQRIRDLNRLDDALHKQAGKLLDERLAAEQHRSSSRNKGSKHAALADYFRSWLYRRVMAVHRT